MDSNQIDALNAYVAYGVRKTAETGITIGELWKSVIKNIGGSLDGYCE